MATEQTVLRLGPADHGRPVSAEDFATAEYLEPWLYERSDGRLRVMSPEGFGHQMSSHPWLVQLIAYELAHSDHIDFVLPNPWVRIDGANDRIGDLGVYLKATRNGLEPPDRMPDLMFEVVSPGREARERDYVEKRADYFRVGIREYVVIDRFQKMVTVFTHTLQGYAERVLTSQDNYTTPLLPDLRIPLSSVF